MQYILLTVRYIPFWALPLIFISGQFLYIFWLKNLRSVAFFFGGLLIFSFSSLLFYIYLGGAEHAVQFVQNLIF